MEGILIGDAAQINRVYTLQQRSRLARMTDMGSGAVVTPADLAADPAAYRDVRWAFSTWGMPSLDEETLQAYLPALQGLFYAAGSVQPFARPFLARGVRVFSAWQANAVPVAEFAVSQILLANKGYFSAMAAHSAGNRDKAVAIANAAPGNYGCRVGILAAGQIGRMVIRALVQRKLQVLVYDPYVSEAAAAALGAQKASLEEIFATCQTISNHLPNLPATRGILDARLFDAMLPNATFINTGRGAQLVEADLIHALHTQPGRTALIDVTEPEVLPADHIFYRMPNVFMTPHIAGSMGDETHRMADYMLEEFGRLQQGEAPLYEVTLPMLETMA